MVRLRSCPRWEKRVKVIDNAKSVHPRNNGRGRPSTSGQSAEEETTTPAKKSGPGAGELILKAVAGSKERKGLSYVALKKALAAQCGAPRRPRHVKSLLERGALVQTKGTGASGSFKAGKAADKPKSVAKKPAAKAKKPKAAKPTPKKAKKPAATKAAKSPKKVPRKAPAPAAAAPKKTAKKAAKPKAAKPKKVAAKKTATK